MTAVTDAYARKNSGPLVAMDCSPPRSGDPSFAAALEGIAADFICVAYSPGRSVRMDSVAAAVTIKQSTGIDAIFNLSTRDMNRLALQMHVLGAQALGLENVVVLQGDEFSEKDLTCTKAVGDMTSTELLASIREMSGGRDFRGLRLSAPTTLCSGATIDLGKGIEAEASLVRRKIEAGAEFIIAQSIYDPAPRSEFLKCYELATGESLREPVFWGVQLLVKDGLVFGEPPAHLVRDIEKGRSPIEVAIEVAGVLRKAGADAFYVMPPILKGGARDYGVTREAILAIKKDGSGEATDEDR